MRRSLCVLLVAVFAGCTAGPTGGVPARAAEEGGGAPAVYETVGLGGGGAMYSPASSPHDPKLMFLSCDMSGFYRSTDGGKSWKMVDFRQTKGNTRLRAVFHPTDPDVVYFKGLVSRDRGVTWKALGENTPKGIVEMALDPSGERMMIAGTGEGAQMSRDGGATWSKCEDVSGGCVGIYVDPGSPKDKRVVMIGTSGGVFVSMDDGRTFAEETEGLPWKGLRDFAAGRSEAKGKVLAYCTVGGKNVDGKYVGGVYVSDDLAASWRSALGAGAQKGLAKVDRWGATDISQYALLAVAEGKPETVYASCRGVGYHPPNHSTVYRSDDVGKNWRPVFNRDFRFPNLNVENGWISHSITWIWGGFHTVAGFDANTKHPDTAMWTDGGDMFVTHDGGKSWQPGYTTPATPRPERGNVPGKQVGRWKSNGLEVTTTWEYHIDPFASKRHYICYTDIGFAISEDGGETWRNNSRTGGSPWTNTTYMLAFDPEVKGRAWAAMSNVHDIMHWTYVHDRVRGPGGICYTEDHCEKWKVLTEGLPSAPCTSVVVDPKSPKDSRTLYVTMYGRGVYKSTDGGKSWQKKSKGIRLDENPHTVLVKLHPDGTLFCCVTGRRGNGADRLKFPKVGALYRSTDKGESWEDITKSSPLHWPTGFDFDPADSKVIYLPAATIPGGREGGIYKTTDGGRSWARLLRDEDFAGKGGASYVHGMYATVDPENSKRVYLGTGGHGLWYTSDAGRTWKQSGSVPFGSVHRASWDPDDRSTIYVTTFGGGVFKGKAPAE